jgi:hypothetical protein
MRVLSGVPDKVEVVGKSEQEDVSENLTKSRRAQQHHPY